MSEEGLRFAAKASRLYARRALGMAAGGGLAMGLGGALGSILMYATALPPWSADEATVLKGFGDATSGLYPADESAQQQARVAAALVVTSAGVATVRSAAKRAA